MPTTRRSPRSVFNTKRYWYHVSTTLKRKYIHLIPWDEDNGFNRCGNEPKGKRICVAPTIEQCITALPYIFETTCIIYRTQRKLMAVPPTEEVFDRNVTQEGWLVDPTDFVKIGILKFSDIEKALNIEHVIDEAASGGFAANSGRVLKWWKKVNVKRFIKKA